jgi:hypothetical protein
VNPQLIAKVVTVVIKDMPATRMDIGLQGILISTDNYFRKDLLNNKVI